MGTDSAMTTEQHFFDWVKDAVPPEQQAEQLSFFSTSGPLDEKSEKLSSYAEFYAISQDYIEKSGDIPIVALPFSVRVTNIFKRNRIHTLAELLNTPMSTIENSKGFGKTSWDEVDAFFKTLPTAFNDLLPLIPETPSAISSILLAYCSSIIAGDFSFTSYLSESEQEQIQIYQQAFQVLGPELVQCCVNSPEKITPISSAFHNYYQTSCRLDKIYTAIKSLPLSRQKNKAAGYIHAFTCDEDKRAHLRSFWHSGSDPIASISERALLEAENDRGLLMKFLAWCTFDLHKEIDDIFFALYRQERTKTVLQLRSRKQTLEQIGTGLNLTRERVRQIEAKAMRHFVYLDQKAAILSKIAAETNRDAVLPLWELEAYAGNHMAELAFLLQNCKESGYIYDKQLDAFMIEDTSLPEQIRSLVETLPELIKAEQLSALIRDAEQNLGLPAGLIEKMVFETYQNTGRLYYRGRLNRAMIFESIMRKYYPDGIKVNDPQELQRFRNYVYVEYGEIPMPENDRALAARIMDVSIICGRGIYIPKKEQYIPSELANRIYQYIKDSSQAIFLTNTLFAVFEEDLLNAGVDNKYYLQGILHELYGGQFIFRRDYISKDSSFTSIYTSVIEFIEAAQYPTDRAEIKAAFPGITDVVIVFACSDPEILNYFGCYLHAKHLSVSDGERETLRALLEQTLCDGGTYHIKTIYEKVQNTLPGFFERNAAMVPFSAFSVLEYLFRDAYQFSRPYIGLNRIELGHPSERLHELLYSMDTFSVSDIREFANENHMQIQSLLEYINSCNDVFLLTNSTTMMSISQTGITEELAHAVDRLVSAAVSEPIPICQLTIWNQLPAIAIPWTDWLLYSVLYKWGTSVSVSTSSNQLRHAIPLVSPVGQMNADSFSGLSQADLSAPLLADDLDNIDSLLEDMIGDDILEGLL